MICSLPSFFAYQCVIDAAIFIVYSEISEHNNSIDILMNAHVLQTNTNIYCQIWLDQILNGWFNELLRQQNVNQRFYFLMIEETWSIWTFAKIHNDKCI